MCVGTGLLAQTCGGGSCYGVCLSAGGTIPALVNTLSTAVTTLITVLGTLGGSVTGTTPCTTSTPIPSNWCVSPLTDGGLGTLCSRMASCHNGNGVTGTVADVTIGTALTTIVTAYNALISGLGALGLVARTTCASSYVCDPFLEVAAGQTFTFPLGGGAARYGINMYVGFCACPTGKDHCYDNAITYPCTLA